MQGIENNISLKEKEKKSKKINNITLIDDDFLIIDGGVKEIISIFEKNGISNNSILNKIKMIYNGLPFKLVIDKDKKIQYIIETISKNEKINLKFDISLINNLLKVFYYNRLYNCKKNKNINFWIKNIIDIEKKLGNLKY